MVRTRTRALGALFLGFLGACGGGTDTDSGAPADTGAEVADSARSEGSAPDARPDSAEDTSASEASLDAPALDTASPDAAPDAAEDASLDAAPESAMDAPSEASLDAALEASADGAAAEAGDAGCAAGQQLCGASCVDTQTDSDHCGSCAMVCPSTARNCIAGACTAMCPSNTADCDRNPANGCEAPLDSLSNCGSCGTACTARANTNRACTAGACDYTCSAGFGDCDRVATNGCEAPLNTTANCGRCGNVCSGATPRCDLTSSTCVATCPAGTTLCGTVCVNLQADPTNCGVCARACNAPNGTPACVAGVCQVQSCNAGFADCDRVVTNGCEVNTSSNLAHCGACGAACGTYTNGTVACVMGACSRVCSGAFADCDRVLTNGCEVPTTTITNCGGCGTRCSYANAAAACTAGACAMGACTAGFADCNRSNTDGCETPTTTTANCGACGNTCALANATASCTAGACTVGACSTGFADCDRLPANGCEIDLFSNVNNCGACGRRCVLANATAGCTMAACAVAACTAGFGDCNVDATDGCETNLNTNAMHCGRCGMACPTGRACSLGRCL